MIRLCSPPPGAKFTAAHQHGAKVEAWWYTCRKEIWLFFLRRTMMSVSMNSYACMLGSSSQCSCERCLHSDSPNSWRQLTAFNAFAGMQHCAPEWLLHGQVSDAAWFRHS